MSMTVESNTQSPTSNSPMTSGAPVVEESLNTRERSLGINDRIPL